VDLYVARVSPDGLNWKTSDVVDVRRRSCVY
jgi:hypothetical protein